MNPITPIRILAVEPGVEHAGVAVLEGENLLWYGVKTFSSGKKLSEMRLAIQQHLAAIVEKYQPRVLVVEEPFYAQSLLSDDLVKLAREIKTWGKLKGLKVRSYTPPVV